jgi:hypothetical protein
VAVYSVTGGQTTWAVYPEQAVTQANEWIDQVSEARGWSQEWTDYAHELVEQSRVDPALSALSWFTFGTWGEDASDFWDALNTAWNAVDTSTAPEGWGDMGEAFAQAANATLESEEAIEQGTIDDLVGDTAVATGERLAEAADPTKSWIPWAVGGTLLAVVLWKGDSILKALR